MAFEARRRVKLVAARTLAFEARQRVKLVVTRPTASGAGLLVPTLASSESVRPRFALPLACPDTASIASGQIVSVAHVSKFVEFWRVRLDKLAD